MPRPNFQNKNNKLAEIIRVNHAGEYGAKVIYEGQLKFIKNSQEISLIHSMLEQEKIHLDYFSNQLIERKIRPSALLPLWHIGGYVLGSLSSLLGIKAAMLVTQSVEEVIEEHYQEQLDYLSIIDTEEALYSNIQKFQHDEIEHKHIAIEHDSEKTMFAPILANIVKNICKVSINLSKKF